ncbi:Uncharacterised protein [Mycobacteroides abscessus subsp. abscessus]|uniref:hypothetical protein n=2 Tax=Mycobacteroides abscessus TaxID=36809 RepID=UPI00092B9ED3|nr:hypothetical protein [Mycobacteroides abscessus]SIK15699.1 Uncharacterised protein [Mycobacteroides abscessus subsp. abscessus]MBN7379343.1 hypothetical protein [Mycobacteroides abscessus subsp. massiliense]MDM2402248.1 hypothetical protein [Mycobacteroides abscessus]SIL53702.1 Uncharacterised protein [Mycobacteroides abscessus subsp. abscessus]SIM45436.1 Uncharacterised protein [Mycobacteroides abscessus subsp. abscessus]
MTMAAAIQVLTALLLAAAIGPLAPPVVAGTTQALNYYLDPEHHPRIKAYLIKKDNDR